MRVAEVRFGEAWHTFDDLGALGKLRCGLDLGGDCGLELGNFGVQALQDAGNALSEPVPVRHVRFGFASAS
jgi:hypothetical protein